MRNKAKRKTNQALYLSTSTRPSTFQIGRDYTKNCGKKFHYSLQMNPKTLQILILKKHAYKYFTKCTLLELEFQKKLFKPMLESSKEASLNLNCSISTQILLLEVSRYYKRKLTKTKSLLLRMKLQYNFKMNKNFSISLTHQKSSEYVSQKINQEKTLFIKIPQNSRIQIKLKTFKKLAASSIQASLSTLKNNRQ